VEKVRLYTRRKVSGSKLECIEKPKAHLPSAEDAIASICHVLSYRFHYFSLPSSQCCPASASNAFDKLGIQLGPPFVHSVVAALHDEAVVL
jgi:hypothetical protein